MTCERDATSAGFTDIVELYRVVMKLCYPIGSLEIIAILSIYIYSGVGQIDTTNHATVTRPMARRTIFETSQWSYGFEIKTMLSKIYISSI